MIDIKKILSFVLTVIILLTISTGFNSIEKANAQTDERVIYFVSPEGDDTNQGNKDNPFATLEKARDSIRNLKQKGVTEGVTVYLREGTYYRESSFKLEEQDSGTENAPVVYRAYGNEEVNLVGGVSLKMSDFKAVTDKAILNRMPQEAQGKVMQVDLKAKGITEYGNMPLYGHSMYFLNAVTTYKSGSAAPELFYNGKEMTISRWPNEGFAKVDHVVEMGSQPRNWMDDLKGSSGDSNLTTYIPPEERDDPPKGFTIRMFDDRLKRWSETEDLWMYGYWWWDWSDQSVQVASIDTVSNEISTVQPSGYGVRKDQRYYVYNLLEEIDIPGEWYLNRDTGILYFYPPDDDKNAQVQLSLLTDTMISMIDVSNVNIKGLDMSISRGNAITISGGSNNIISHCKIGRMASNAVSINEGIGHGVVSSIIYDMGAGGIFMVGGDRVTLTPGEHYAENNHIYNFARIAKTYRPAISIGGVGNRISFNKIHDGPHAGIIFGGNDHVIEYNEIFDVVKESQDMGAIYGGRNLTARGNVFRYNFIHSITGVEGGHSDLIYGIYFDDMISGSEVVGNIFYDVPSGVHVNGGRDNIMDNNIFINIANRPIMISTSGFMDLFAPHWENSGYGLKADPYGGPMVPWDKEPYTKYPNMTNIMEDEPKHPKYNSVSRNVFYNSKDLQIWLRGNLDFGEDRVREYSTIDDNFLTNTDPGFVDADNMNFGLKEDSEVYSKIPGFERIPFDKIGLVSASNTVSGVDSNTDPVATNSPVATDQKTSDSTVIPYILLSLIGVAGIVYFKITKFRAI